MDGNAMVMTWGTYHYSERVLEWLRDHLSPQLHLRRGKANQSFDEDEISHVASYFIMVWLWFFLVLWDYGIM